MSTELAHWHDRAVEAEARIARLEEALRAIESFDSSTLPRDWFRMFIEVQQLARNALSQDTPSNGGTE